MNIDCQEQNFKKELQYSQVVLLAVDNQGHAGGGVHPGAGGHAPHPPRPHPPGHALLQPRGERPGDRGHRDLVLQGGRQEQHGHRLQHQGHRSDPAHAEVNS